MTYFKEFLQCCEIWCLHGGESSSRGLLGCDVVQCCERIPTFRRTFLTSPWKWWQQGPPKSLYPTTTLLGVTTQKTSTWIFTAERTPNLASNILTVSNHFTACQWFSSQLNILLLSAHQECNDVSLIDV